MSPRHLPDAPARVSWTIPRQPTHRKAHAVAIENRLSGELLAALAPGDMVCIESAGDFARPRYSTGTVIRIEGSYIVVVSKSARGVPYVHRYGRRDGIRTGGGRRGELVNRETVEEAMPARRRQTLHIDTLYRQWARNRSDPERLRQLYVAIGECLALEEVAVPQ
jgi:hypothetical protein